MCGFIRFLRATLSKKVAVKRANTNEGTIVQTNKRILSVSENIKIYVQKV